jgi:hypothetical protein
VVTVRGKSSSYELIEISARIELVAKAAKPGGNLRGASRPLQRFDLKPRAAADATIRSMAALSGIPA